MSADTQGKNMKVCRLCLATTATFFSLTEANEDSSMLDALTSLKILPSDEISTGMCLKCRLNLRLAFSIQQSMLRAQERFRCRQLTITELVKPETEEAGEGPQIPAQEVSKVPKSDLSYECDICLKVFHRKRTLKMHKYNVHVKPQCPICGKHITQTNLKRHIDRHTEPQTMCELCGASIKMQDLRNHIFHRHRGHSYNCNFCDKAFKTKRSQVVHEQREHLGVANFVCDTCGKRFFMVRDLNTHVNMKHLKLRPYVCDYCKVGFSSKFALKTHRRQHTNEAPYKCEICGDAFKQKVSMKTHLKSKHDVQEELTCECQVCGKKFAGKIALMARVHIEYCH